MSRLLFYAGVFFTLLLGGLAAIEAIASFGGRIAVAAPQGNLHVPVGILLVAVPVAAIFLRMASLLAARNLFNAFFAVFAIASTAVAVAFLATMQLRHVFLLRSNGTAAAIESVDQFTTAASYAAGFFLVITLLSLRPYFRIQSSRFLSVIVVVPALLYAWLVGEQLVISGELSSPAGSPVMASSLVVAALLFGTLAVHCLRHRHLFIEVTNLRELLDMRVDPAGVRSRLPLGSDVALDGRS